MRDRVLYLSNFPLVNKIPASLLWKKFPVL